MATVNNIILNSSVEELENIISPFIQDQFPDFMKKDYNKLIFLIKAYYEWLELPTNSGYVLQKLNTVKDIDSNAEEFFKHFKNTYLESFPDLLAVNAKGERPNRKTLLKRIRDFYGNKGTESSYKFLFRVLYDNDVEIYSPKVDILKVSDGEWYEPKSIKTTSSNGKSLFSVIGGEIIQYSTTSVDIVVATAFIDSVVQYIEFGAPITEIFITNISGDFSPDTQIVIRKGENIFREVSYSVLGEFFIETPGSGYVVGNQIFVVAEGQGFSAFVEVIGLAGAIKKISIKKSGINFFTSVYGIIISETGTNSTGSILFNSGAVTNYPGFFRSNKGKISSNKKIQDGNYYQEFSYDLRSGLSLNRYFSVLNSIIHPAGMKMFGSILLQSKLNVEIDGVSGFTLKTEPIIGNFTPYTIGTTLDLRNNGMTATNFNGDLYPFGYNPYITGPNVIVNGLTSPLGTEFIGVTGMNNTSIFYTYAVMPESGITAHSPLGSPLSVGVVSQFSYWDISNYGSDLLGLSAGLSFGSVTLEEFINSPLSVSATYRSIRSINITNGEVFEVDTYTGSFLNS